MQTLQIKFDVQPHPDLLFEFLQEFVHGDVHFFLVQWNDNFGRQSDEFHLLKKKCSRTITDDGFTMVHAICKGAVHTEDLFMVAGKSERDEEHRLYFCGSATEYRHRVVQGGKLACKVFNAKGVVCENRDPEHLRKSPHVCSGCLCAGHTIYHCTELL